MRALIALLFGVAVIAAGCSSSGSRSPGATTPSTADLGASSTPTVDQVRARMDELCNDVELPAFLPSDNASQLESQLRDKQRAIEADVIALQAVEPSIANHAQDLATHVGQARMALITADRSRFTTALDSISVDLEELAYSGLTCPS
jgi:hypothetical protein